MAAKQRRGRGLLPVLPCLLLSLATLPLVAPLRMAKNAPLPSPNSVQPASKSRIMSDTGQSSPGDQCFYAHLDCGSCTADPNCGWCSVGQEADKCVQGSENGIPWDCEKWHYGPDTCGSEDKGVLPLTQKMRNAEKGPATTTTTPPPNMTATGANRTNTTNRTVSPDMLQAIEDEKRKALENMKVVNCDACDLLKELATFEAGRTFEPLPKPRLRKRPGQDEEEKAKKEASAKPPPCIRYAQNTTTGLGNTTCDTICYADPRCKSYKEVPNPSGLGAKCNLFNITGCDPAPPEEDYLSKRKKLEDELERRRRKGKGGDNKAATDAQNAADEETKEAGDAAKKERDQENAEKAGVLDSEENKLLAKTIRADKEAAGRVPEDDYPFPAHFVLQPHEKRIYPKSAINNINVDYLRKHPE